MKEKTKVNYTNRLRYEFQSEALEIIEKPASPLGHLMIWLIIVLIITIISWACLSKVDVNATALGVVATTNGVYYVQSASSGMIKECKLTIGQKIRKGDILYTIEDSIEEDTVLLYQKETADLSAKIEYATNILKHPDKAMTAEASGDTSTTAYQTVWAIYQSQQDKLKEAQNQKTVASSQYELEQEKLTLYETQTSSIEKKLSLLKKNMSKDNQETITLASLKKRKKQLKKQLDNAKKEYQEKKISKPYYDSIKEEYQTLIDEIQLQKQKVKDQKTSDKNSVLDYEAQLKQLETEKEIQKKQVQVTKQQKLAADSNYDELVSSNRLELTQLIEQWNKELAEQQLALSNSQSALQYKTILADFDGIVNQIHVQNKGAVVAETEVLAELTPTQKETIVEAELANQDVGYVKEGQLVQVKLDTYDYQKYGTWKGKVIHIGSDSLENEQGQRIYKVQVALQGNEVSPKLEPELGMTGTVEIKTDERSLITFLLNPIFDKIKTGFSVR